MDTHSIFVTTEAGECIVYNSVVSFETITVDFTQIFS